MAKVKFTRDYNHRWSDARGQASTLYREGHTYTVKREVADVAVAMGAAKEVGTVGRKATGKAAADGESTD